MTLTHLLVTWAESDGQHSKSFFCFSDAHEDEASHFCLMKNGAIQIVTQPGW
jgi:hypothetical protein